MSARKPENKDHNTRGFTIIELLIVVAMILILAAIAVPSISRYIRNYRINAAARMLTSELQTARLKAVSKNVKRGVFFVVEDVNHFRWALDDDMRPNVPAASRFLNLDWNNVIAAAPTPLDDNHVGPQVELPLGIEFDTTCAGATPPNAYGLKFQSLGAFCAISATDVNCTPPLNPPGANFIFYQVDGSGALQGACIALIQRLGTGPGALTQLRREITITPGGRIDVQ